MRKIKRKKKILDEQTNKILSLECERESICWSVQIHGFNFNKKK